MTPDALDGNCETVCVSLGAAQKIWIQSAEESDCCWESKHTSCVVQDDVTANTSKILDTAKSFLYFVNKEKDMKPNTVTRRSSV